MTELVSWDPPQTIHLGTQQRNSTVRTTLPSGRVITATFKNDFLGDGGELIAVLDKNGTTREIGSADYFFEQGAEDETVPVNYVDDSTRFVGEVEGDGNRRGIVESGEAELRLVNEEARRTTLESTTVTLTGGYPTEEEAIAVGSVGAAAFESSIDAEVRLDTELHYGVSIPVSVTLTNTQTGSTHTKTKTVNVPGNINFGGTNSRSVTFTFDVAPTEGVRYRVQARGKTATTFQPIQEAEASITDCSIGVSTVEPGDDIPVALTVSTPEPVAVEALVEARIDDGGTEEVAQQRVSLPSEGSKQLSLRLTAPEVDGEFDVDSAVRSVTVE